jgi:predicted small integral membrane protein
MSVRLLKVILVFCVGAQALFYAIQNVVNLDAAYAAVAYVLSMGDHAVYPQHFAPAVTWSPLVWAALAVVIVGETLAGVLCGYGTVTMWLARRGSADAFRHASQPALLGCGIGVVVWLGLFMAVGGAWFQMWQTEGGRHSLEGAFMYAVSSAVVLLFVNQHESPVSPG